MPIQPIGAPGTERILNEQGAALPVPATEPADGSKSFGQFLLEALGDVNALQQQSGAMVRRFATGENLDIHQVMIAMERASTAMQLTTQISNRLVEAYQEILRTQV